MQYIYKYVTYIPDFTILKELIDKIVGHLSWLPVWKEGEYINDISDINITYITGNGLPCL